MAAAHNWLYTQFHSRQPLYIRSELLDVTAAEQLDKAIQQPTRFWHKIWCMANSGQDHTKADTDAASAPGLLPDTR